MTNRKDDHVQLALEYENMDHNDFDSVKFVYSPLTHVNYDDIDLSTRIAGLDLEFPFYINAMTGGSKNTKEINKKLAMVASQTNIAIASGSLSAAIKDERLEDSFKVIRDYNKEGIVFANLGAEYTSIEAQKAINILDANAMQIHLNVIQEMVMPEGDKEFSHWSDNIKDIVEHASVPVIVKEVGFGMSRKSIQQLVDLGVSTIDVSGSGGTNFASIENSRRDEHKLNYLDNFGQSTIISLLEASDYTASVDIIASGGIRNALDISKALALGARAVGISGLILKNLDEYGVDHTVSMINNFKEDLKVIMTILNVKNIHDFVNTDLILSGSVKEWCIARGIDHIHFANRVK